MFAENEPSMEKNKVVANSLPGVIYTIEGSLTTINLAYTLERIKPNLFFLQVSIKSKVQNN